MARFKLHLNPEQHANSPIRSSMHTILDVACDYYKYHLSKNDDALAYLTSRGFDKTIIEKFDFGLSPSGYNQLTSQKNNKVWKTTVQRALGAHLDDEALSDAVFNLMLTTGLLRLNSRDEYTDRYRGRIVVPIKDESGQIISFGGRIFTEEQKASKSPKYLNGSETPLFKKRDNLFGLHFLNSLKDIPFVIVTEGYLDVATLHQFKLPNSVCSMGTAVSTSQIETLFSYTNHLVFCFDGDEAGTKAAMRAAENIRPCLEGSRNASFVFLPEGEDPDSILRQGQTSYSDSIIDAHRDEFLNYLDNAVPMLSMLERLAEYHSGCTWDENPRLIMAYLLNDILEMPSNSQLGSELQTQIQLKAQQLSRNDDEFDEQQMVNFIAQMS